MPGSGDQRPKSQRHQKEFNLKKGDLPNVNCHLTPPPPCPPPPSHWAPAAGHGWKGNLIKGSLVTKDPPLLSASSSSSSRQKQKTKKWDWFFVLMRAKDWKMLLHKLYEENRKERWAMNKKICILFVPCWLINTLCGVSSITKQLYYWQTDE